MSNLVLGSKMLNLHTLKKLSLKTAYNVYYNNIKAQIKPPC